MWGKLKNKWVRQNNIEHPPRIEQVQVALTGVDINSLRDLALSLEKKAPFESHALSEADIDSLRDLALSLEKGAPFESYSLFRIALKHRPWGPVLREKVEQFEHRTMPNTVIAWRWDGLCERLNAVVIGRFTALALDLDFKFFWPDLSRLEEVCQTTYGTGHSVGTEHSVPEATSQIFAPAFISEYQIEQSVLLAPLSGFHFYSPALRPFVLDSFKKLEDEQAIARPYWLACVRSFPELAAAHDPGEYWRFFRNDLFNEKVMAQFDAIDALDLPMKRITLHVRAGDVIYGASRQSVRIAREKTISLAVAGALCENLTAQGYTVLLFGASPADLACLADGNEEVITVGDLGLVETDPTSEVLRDVYLMAGCAQIVSAADTGVSKLAVLVGKAELVPYTQLLSSAEEYRVSHDCMISGKIKQFHILQQAFVHYSLFITAPETVDILILLDHVREAHRCDPEDVPYMALCLLAAYVAESQRDIETFERRLSRALSGPAETCFANAALRNRYLALEELSVQRLLGAAAKVSGVPSYIMELYRQ